MEALNDSRSGNEYIHILPAQYDRREPCTFHCPLPPRLYTGAIPYQPCTFHCPALPVHLNTHVIPLQPRFGSFSYPLSTTQFVSRNTRRDVEHDIVLQNPDSTIARYPVTQSTNPFQHSLRGFSGNTDNHNQDKTQQQVRTCKCGL